VVSLNLAHPVDDFSLDCLQYILSSLADINAAD